jgi:hypothetical protein
LGIHAALRYNEKVEEDKALESQIAASDQGTKGVCAFIRMKGDSKCLVYPQP